jgi:hypothetical protein
MDSCGKRVRRRSSVSTCDSETGLWSRQSSLESTLIPASEQAKNVSSASSTTASEEAVSATAVQSPKAKEGGTANDTFVAFCGLGRAGMDGRSFAKMCRDARLLDKKLTQVAVDIVFAKVTLGHRQMHPLQLELALALLAEKKGVDVEAVRSALVAISGGPVLYGTRAAAVRLHDDVTGYTGTWSCGGPETGRKGLGATPRFAGSVHS